MASDIKPTTISGLASGLDTKSIIESLIEVEKKKIEPVINRKEQKTVELDAWKQVKAVLETSHQNSDILAKKSLWEGKIVTSSDPEVVEAIATSGAKPGKYTLAVDKLALNHQIASQNFKSKEEQVGHGEVLIKVGEETEYKISIDETNDTVQGFADAIQALDGDISANIIKTGNKEKPFQIVLTSKKTGLEGKIEIMVNLQGEGEPPTFDPYYLQPGKWKGIHRDKAVPRPTGTGASTAIPELIGNYTGEEPIDLKFTVVNTGIVGVSENLRMRWEDNTGRFGYLDLGSFNYTPGEPIEVVDGIQLVISDGEIIVNDTFESRAKNAESDMFWWKSDEERLANITQPSSWGRQATEGGPVISGKYTGDENDSFTLKVVGSGQIGAADDLRIEYESENGLKGTAFIGKGYEPGTQLSLGKGLELSLKPGLLSDGDFATFDYQAESTAEYWWLDDEERVEGDQVVNLTNWMKPEEREEEEIEGRAKKPEGARISTAKKSIVGKYSDFESKTYTFTAMKSGAVGTTQELELRWEDNKGNSGILNIGEGYQTGTPIEFDSGLSLVMDAGSIFETDSFTFRTFSPVIQPPQDAEIRLGATELGGGLLITNSTNTLEDVIEGVKLELLSTGEKPVTINIRGDTEKAIAGIKEFVDSYNQMLGLFKEATKYDQESGEAGPLQGDRNLPRIQQELNKIFINPVTGLDSKSNQLFTIGLKINKEGLIEVDEEKLTNAINDNLGNVANLFWSFGAMDNSGISYLSSSEKTKISGSKGFDIDILEAASKGYYETPAHLQGVMIDDTNNKVIITVNGKDSEEIQLEKGAFSIDEVTRQLQKAVFNDKNIGKLNISVTSDQGKIILRSNITGSRSSVTVRSALPPGETPHFMLGGNVVNGSDVKGTINGEEMEGGGQILTGKKGTDFEGLKLYVSLTKNQLGEGAETNLIFTKGVATKVKEYIEGIMRDDNGALGIYTKNVQEQLKGYEKEVKTLEERIDSKRKKLQLKFAKLESKMGQLKSEQNYLTNQLSKLG